MLDFQKYDFTFNACCIDKEYDELTFDLKKLNFHYLINFYMCHPYKIRDYKGNLQPICTDVAYDMFRMLKDKGIKTAFLSDSFSAYKKTLLNKIGGFPDVNFGEDTYVAAKLLMNGYKTAYCAEAKVYHSHGYSLLQDYKRSKEIGQFHKQEKWLLKTFGKAEGEGLNFVINEAKYLVKNGKLYYLPIAFLHNVVKYLGYKIGWQI